MTMLVSNINLCAARFSLEAQSLEVIAFTSEGNLLEVFGINIVLIRSRVLSTYTPLKKMHYVLSKSRETNTL